jgi:hypothetical protein
MEAGSPPDRYPRSCLFTVRVRREELGDGAAEMRMEVRYVMSGDVHHFRRWSDMVAYMQTEALALEAPAPQD